MTEQRTWKSALNHLRMILTYKLLRLLLWITPEQDADGRVILYAILTAGEKIKRNSETN